MTKTGKIFLGCGGTLLAAGVVVLILGYFFLGPLGHRLNDYFKESSKADREAGEAYAQTVDQNGCIDEGIKRSKEFPFYNLNRAIALGDFVNGCLTKAKPVKDFCSGTPGISLHDTEWAHQQCELRGVDPEKTACAHVYASKNLYCAGPH